MGDWLVRKVKWAGARAIAPAKDYGKTHVVRISAKNRAEAYQKALDHMWTDGGVLYKLHSVEPARRDV